MKAGALFAGYGGIELAVHEVLGADPAWVSEFDTAPSKILAHHWPDVPNLGDVTKVDWSQVEPVDVITGGSPCQDLSHAGKRAGMRAGTRSGLWASMCDAIDIIRPPLVLWENVRGALSAAADSAVEPCSVCVGDGRGVTLRALGRVLGDLSELGYDAAWVGLPASGVGAPHGRFRIFVLAWPGSDPDATEFGRWASGRNDRVRPAGLESGAEAVRKEALLPTPTVSDTNGAGAHGAGGLDLRTAVSLLPTPAVADVQGGRKGRSGARSDELLLNGLAAAQGFGQYSPAITRWESHTRPAPSPTEPTGKGGAHRLSPAFVEWMMGLPAGWVTDVDITRNEQLKALGNGVVPQQCAAALRHLLAVRASVLEVAA